MAAAQDFLKSALLIAMPNLKDPRFERSVVFLCEHDARHAFGLIINKPIADVPMTEVLDKLEIHADDATGAGPVYYGGPVGMDRGAVLHSLDYRSETTIEVAPDVGLTMTRDIIVDIASSRRRQPPPRRHVFAIGYAGWGEGQLESEIAANSWAHCAFDAEIVFARDPSTIWDKALSKLGVTAAMLAGPWMKERPAGAPLH